MIRKMKNIFKYKFKGLAVLSLLAGLAFLSSCDDEESGSKEVVLLSFGPSGVHHGDEIVFIGQNLDKVSSIVFQPGVEVASSSFTSVSSEKFTVIVPHEAEAGKMILKTPTGDIESKTILNFEVPVVISGFTAEAKPGTKMTFTGDKLNWIESITFTSDITVEKKDFVKQTLTELELIVPMNAQSGFITFATGGTEPLTFGTETQLTVTLPAITSLNTDKIRHEGELTINGTNLDLVTSVVFAENKEVMKANFLSQSATAIKVAIPRQVVKGKVTLKQASPINIVSAGELTIALPVGTAISPVPATPGTTAVTITGTDLDLVKSLTLQGSGALLASNFTSQSATEIVFTLPAGTNQGPIEYLTVHDFKGPLGVVVILPGDGPPPLIASVYEDATASTVGQGGGWSSTTTWGSTDQAIQGTNSIKVTYTGGGAGAQFGTWGKPDLTFPGATVFTFAVYGGAGSEGKTLRAGLKSSGDWVWKNVTMAEGKWTTYEILLSEWNFTFVREIAFDNNNGAFIGTIFIDRVGFSTVSPPPSLITPVFQEATASTVGQGGGWNTTTVWNSEEYARVGTKAIKITYTGAGGAGAQLGTWGKPDLSLAGTTKMLLSAYGGTGTGGKTLRVGLKSSGDWVWKNITIEEGKWKDYEIPLSEWGFTFVREIAFDNNNGATTGIIYLDHVGFR